MDEINNFLDKATVLIIDKPLVVIVLAGMVLWAVIFIRTGRNPLRSRKNYVEKGDLRDAEQRIEKALTAHNASNEKDFQEMKEQIDRVDDNLSEGFREMNKRIDNIMLKR